MRISDWSADVCSSDLNFSARVLFAGGVTAGLAPHLQAAGGTIDVETARARMIDTYAGMPYRPALVAPLRQIGRASCRERVCPSVSNSLVALSLKNKY